MNHSWKKRLCIALIFCLGAMSIGVIPAAAAGDIFLYTPYTSLSVPPGERVSFNVDLVNDSNVVHDFQLSVQAPEEWNYQFTTSGRTVEGARIRPNDERMLTFLVDVPLQVDKGEYAVILNSPEVEPLHLTIHVSEQGTYHSQLTSEQPNMQGAASSSFFYELQLHNQTAEDQLYALAADVPRGWTATFNVNGTQATSAQVEANQRQRINVTINPPAGIQADTYVIPVLATTSTTSAEVDLEVVISGSYDMQLTTPTGLLSTDITAGKDRRMEFEIRNSGSSTLEDIRMSHSSPYDWEVSFEPERVESIAAGDAEIVVARIISSDQAIPGDYVTSITASTPEATSSAHVRVTVKTSMLWGWIGILIITAVIVGIAILFRKYGRQ